MDIWDSPLLFTNVVLIDLPIYHRHITARPSPDHNIIPTLPAISSGGPLLSWNDFPQMGSVPYERVGKKNICKIKNAAFSRCIKNLNPDFFFFFFTNL